MKAPVELRLKAEMGKTERVKYLHRAFANSYEDRQLRHQQEESLTFESQSETLKSGPTGTPGLDQFTQVMTVTSKDGTANLHDFAMPEPGESLEVTADSRGRILRSGDYPPNSIFYVPPVSLPDHPVSIGDTWTMQSAWLSLEEMVPYQLDMVSILKGFYKCGTDTCAEIEISGDVGFQGPINQTMRFNSNWKGRMFFALNAGTVVWSRVDSEERLVADNVRRDVDSCLESVLQAPEGLRIPGLEKPTCSKITLKDTQTASE